jgi:hypothetical protein
VTIDLAANRALLYERLKSHAAGAAVRAATGPGTAGGVIPTHLLRAPLPARPFLCSRAGVISGQSDAMRGVVLTWWIYDDPGQGYARINALITLIAAAYPLNALPWGETKITLVGQEGEDEKLGGLLMCPVQITYSRRA